MSAGVEERKRGRGREGASNLERVKREAREGGNTVCGLA